MSNNTSLTDEEENGVRLQLLLGLATSALQRYFHRYYPSNPIELYKELKGLPVYSKLNKLRSRKVITYPQWCVLFPQAKQTDSKQFDITLLFVLLVEICDIEPPEKGWHNNPPSTDTSDAAFIVRVKRNRDKQKHYPGLNISSNEFNALWEELGAALLHLNCSSTDINDIKRKHLDKELLNKYQTATDANLRLQYNLQKLLREKQKLRNAVENGVSYGVLPNVPSHVVREGDVQSVHEKMLRMDCSKIAFVITGLGGVGKTELARYYCHEYTATCYENNVIWINAETRYTLQSSIQSIAECIQVATKDYNGEEIQSAALLHRVYQFFGERSALFVFDNANDYSFMEEYFKIGSPNDSIKILITSQFTHWGERFVKYALDVLPLHAAEKFVSGRLSEAHVLTDQNCKEICHLMQRLPLALQQCVSYIVKNSMRVDAYIELFREYNTELLSEPGDDVCYQKTVLTTWKMALEKLKQNNTSLALDMIICLSFLDGKNIDQQLVTRVFNSNLIAVNKAVRELCSYSLVNSYCQNGRSFLTVHSLVQKSIQIAFSESDQFDIDSYVFRFLESIFNPGKVNMQHFNYGSLWRHHLLHIVTNFKKKTKVMCEVLKHLQILLPAFYNTLKFSELLTLLDALYDSLKDEYVSTDPALVELTKQKNEVIDVLKRFEEFQNAMSSLQGKKQDHAKYHSIALSLSELEKEFTSSNLLTAIRKFKNNELEDALHYFQKAKDEETSLMRECIDFWIARCLSCLGESDEALDMFTKIHHVFRKTFGGSHCFVLICEMAEVFCIMQQGDYVNACNISDMNLPRFEEEYGYEHPVVLHSRMLQDHVRNMKVLTGYDSSVFSQSLIPEFENIIKHFKKFRKSCPELKRIVANLEEMIIKGTAFEE